MRKPVLVSLVGGEMWKRFDEDEDLCASGAGAYPSSGHKIAYQEFCSKRVIHVIA